MTTLNRRFSPFSLLLLSINGMIGSAWLFAPLYAAKIAGSGALFAWLLAGIATIFIAMTFAEISALLPVAGGTTRLSNLSHGAITSFFMSWVAWLSSVTTPPIEVQAVLQYSSTYFPRLIHTVNHVPALSHLGLAAATFLMLLLSFINVASFKGLVRFNFVLFCFKVGIIIATIFLLIHTQFHPENFADLPNAHLQWHGILAAIATGGIAFAFAGFKHGVELAGESKNPSVAMPLAIVGSVVICLLVYMGLQIAFMGAMPAQYLTQGWSHLSFAGDAGPLVGLAGILGLAWLVKFLYMDSVVSPLGAGLIYTTSTARIVYAMSKNGTMPAIFSKLNHQNFPMFAVGFNFVIGMFLFLPLPGWQAMMSFLVSVVALSYAMGPISLLCLRKELPLKNRPFRLRCANISCFLAFYFCNLITFWAGWDTLSKLGIALLIGAFLFLYAHRNGKTNRARLGLKAVIWIVPYLSGLILFSYLGSFGGGRGILTFGWDFLVFAIFSGIILFLAVRSRETEIHAQFDEYEMESNPLLSKAH